MTTHAEQRLIHHTPEQLFDLVADVRRYPEFLPWCLAARIRERTHTTLVADLIICLLYTSPSPRDLSTSRMPSSA